MNCGARVRALSTSHAWADPAPSSAAAPPHTSTSRVCPSGPAPPSCGSPCASLATPTSRTKSPPGPKRSSAAQPVSPLVAASCEATISVSERCAVRFMDHLLRSACGVLRHLPRPRRGLRPNNILPLTDYRTSNSRSSKNQVRCTDSDSLSHSARAVKSAKTTRTRLWINRAKPARQRQQPTKLCFIGRPRTAGPTAAPASGAPAASVAPAACPPPAP